MSGWLVALVFAVFVFFTDDYVVAGVLPEIAHDLRVSEAAAGQLITVFSLTIALAAPVASVVAAHWSRRRLFAGSLVVFVAANGLAAVAPAYGPLVALRVGAALAAAASTPALFAVTAALAPADRRGRYLAAVSLGVTGSLVAGVPLGTWLGAAVGWRWTFAAMAAAGVLALAGIAATLPATPAPPATGLRERLRPLVAAPVTLGLAANLVTILASMMLLTYLAPFVRELAGAGPGTRGALFAASGLAGMLGIWLGGLATDRWGQDRTLLAGIGAFVASMLVFTLLWPLRPIPVAVVVPVALVWAGSAFWNSPAIQARLFLLAGPSGAQALALNTSSSYLGTAVGGALGGILLAHAGVVALAPASAILGAVALAVFAAATRAGRVRTHTSAAGR
ncbi:Predicted arabinose efflux permease, MFS family [Amycolatopsis arida]|uniref:Predicted arabinose efflux permease, MFS family n=1 Tax=Amycolatopsis arida TaxID=587909 RepID=A0A1I5VEG5_9PSEU|nr:MFS transporter [Amycolatopsis arida]TDX91254.1 putative MFS family arabinose efflux permease [Amycolatopsis arida]SFQ05934.1 Predicted arabinose efflux permease, MFS family [Amycolatopsis arida]